MDVMTFRILLALAVITGSVAGAADESPSPAVPSPEHQIAAAVAAAPEDRRADARVLGYAPDGELTILREGSNDLICVADQPGDGRFQAVCYHESLEPFIARGRELRAAGVEDTLERRHQEVDAGRLEMPRTPTLLYNLNGPPDAYNPETGSVERASWLWVIYTPYATPESTGLPTTEQAPGGPWIMRSGTASSHIMIVQPKSPTGAS
jgi:hypothetical protein